MSYYKVKSLSTKGDKLTITVASSNVTPASFFRTEYPSGDGESFQDTLGSFFTACLDGDFRLYQGCKYADGVQAALDMKRTILSALPEEELWDYQMAFRANADINGFLTGKVLLPGAGYGEKPSEAAIRGGVSALLNGIRDLLFLEKAKWETEGKIPVRSALGSELFPGYTVVSGKDRTWLCPSGNYEPGVLYSKRGGNIEFSGTDGDLFYALAGNMDAFRRLPEETAAEVMKKTEALGMTGPWYTELLEERED